MEVTEMKDQLEAARKEVFAAYRHQKDMEKKSSEATASRWAAEKRFEDLRRKIESELGMDLWVTEDEKASGAV